MKNINKEIIQTWTGICVILFLTGCAYNSAPRSTFSSKYDNWHKADTNSTEIQKAMLECGYQNAAGETSLMKMRCMQKSGFKNWEETACKSDGSGSRKIVWGTECKVPDEDVPDRNISLRLNSWLCQHVSKNNILCQP